MWVWFLFWFNDLRPQSWHLFHPRNDVSAWVWQAWLLFAKMSSDMTIEILISLINVGFPIYFWKFIYIALFSLSITMWLNSNYYYKFSNIELSTWIFFRFVVFLEVAFNVIWGPYSYMQCSALSWLVGQGLC